MLHAATDSSNLFPLFPIGCDIKRKLFLSIDFQKLVTSVYILPSPPFFLGASARNSFLVDTIIERAQHDLLAILLKIQFNFRSYVPMLTSNSTGPSVSETMSAS